MTERVVRNDESASPDDPDTLAARLIVASRAELIDPASELRRAMAGDPELERAVSVVVDAERLLAEMLRSEPAPAPAFTTVLTRWRRRRLRRLLVIAGYTLGGLLLAWTLVGIALALWGLSFVGRETFFP